MLVFLLVLALLVVAALLVLRTPAGSRLLRGGWRRQAPATPPPPAVGETIPVRTSPIATVPMSALLLVVIALLIVLSIAVLPRSLFAPGDQFLVQVAPFTNSSGTVDESGRSAARDLVAALQAAGVPAVAIDTAPATVSEALNQMNDDGADALLYGTLADGAMLDQPSLTPVLVYAPSGSFAPAVWEEYRARFAMPRAYTLSAQPINGQAVLPPLMLALGRYGKGDYDNALAELDGLLNAYPDLAQPLPRAIRGNILWATGNYAAAATEYERTGVMSMPAEQPSEMALLANNLGAIYADAGDPRADQAFGQATALLGEQQLTALRVNLARSMLAQQHYDEAIATLESIRETGASSGALLTLADAYLGAQQLEDAQLVLDQTSTQLREETSLGPKTLNDIASERDQLQLRERQIRLELSRAVGTNDLLMWELLSGQELTSDELEGPRDDLAGLTADTEANSQQWLQQAAAADVAQQTYAAQIDNNQARLVEGDRYQRRKLLAAVELDLARERNAQDRTLDTIIDIFRNQRNTQAPLQTEIDELWNTNPNDVEAGVLRGFGQLAFGQTAPARDTFNAVNAFAVNRPEPLFGLALSYVAEDRGRAKQLLGDAIARDANFYPARTRLAELAEQDSEWATAIEQRRWMAENHGTDQDKLTLARVLQNSGPTGFAEAEQVLLPLANANNAEALVHLSNLYIAAGNYSAAQSSLERAQKAAPNDADIAYQLGLVFNQLGQSDQARQQFEQAVSLETKAPQARVELGKIYTARGQIDRAAQQYDAALRDGANDPDTLQEIGRVLLLASEYERAREAYSKAIEQRPDSAVAHLGLARASLALNDPTTAAREAELAATLPGGDTAETKVLLGEISLAFGDTAGALGHFTLAYQQNPNLPDAQLGLGRTAAFNGEWSVALSYFNQVISLNPNLAEAHYWKAESLLQTGDTAGAQTEYEAALSLRATYPEAHLGLAKAKAALGSYAEAHASVKQALAQRPTYADAQLLDGLIYENQGNKADARRAYGRAIDADSRLAEAYYRRALLTISEGNITNAAGDLEAATRQRPNFPEAHYWLGRSYLANGNAERAAPQFEQAISQSPNSSYPEAQYYQGVAREQMGDIASAYSSYQQVVAQAPGGILAAEAQAALIRLGQ